MSLARKVSAIALASLMVLLTAVVLALFAIWRIPPIEGAAEEAARAQAAVIAGWVVAMIIGLAVLAAIWRWRR